ncbi:hypothetical protein ACFTAO_20950 [Paenibacillus rhizoplanae]
MMNTVLLILIILASTLAASSSSLMYSTSSALDSFIETSKVADLNVTLANTPRYNTAVQDWVKQEKKLEAAYTERQISLSLEQITMPEGRKSFFRKYKLRVGYYSRTGEPGLRGKTMSPTSFSQGSSAFRPV